MNDSLQSELQVNTERRWDATPHSCFTCSLCLLWHRKPAGTWRRANDWSRRCKQMFRLSGEDWVRRSRAEQKKVCCCLDVEVNKDTTSSWSLHKVKFSVCLQPRITIHPSRRTTCCSMRLSDACSPVPLSSTLRLYPSRHFLFLPSAAAPGRTQTYPQQHWSMQKLETLWKRPPCCKPTGQTLGKDLKKCSQWGRGNAGKAAHDVNMCFVLMELFPWNHLLLVVYSVTL